MSTQQEILTILKKAYDCSQRGAEVPYRRYMERAKAAIGQMPDDVDSGKNALQGEWFLISACMYLQTPEECCKTLRKAAELLQGPSQVVPKGTHLLRGDYHLFNLWNPNPGYADEVGETMKEVSELFYRLTRGGKGADICYQAQIAYYRGDFEQAKTFAKQAIEIGRQYDQESICLGAADVLASIVKHTHEEPLWDFAFEIIEEIRLNGKTAIGPVSAELVYCNINLALGLLQSVPGWVREGDFGVLPEEHGYQSYDENFPIGIFPMAIMTQMMYQCYSGQFVAALDTAEKMEKVYHLNSTILNAYVAFFRVTCYAQLGEIDRAAAAMEKAIRLIEPDGLWLIAAEFAQPFGEHLYEAAGKVDPQAPRRIQEIGEGFWEKLIPLRQKAMEDVPETLSAREQEVVDLLLQGKTNTQIAEELHISARTVGAHLENIYRKHNIKRRTQLPEALQKNAVELANWIEHIKYRK